ARYPAPAIEGSSRSRRGDPCRWARGGGAAPPFCLTEKGFSPPQAAALPGRAVRRLGALARPSPSIADSARLWQNELVGHVAPCQFKYCFAGFHGKSFPWVKAVTHLGRGALRLSGGL